MLLEAYRKGNAAQRSNCCARSNAAICGRSRSAMRAIGAKRRCHLLLETRLLRVAVRRHKQQSWSCSELRLGFPVGNIESTHRATGSFSSNLQRAVLDLV